MTCTEFTKAGAPVGAPCDNCGHTNVVHPGPHNPALITCVLCELLDLADQHESRTRS